MRHIFPRILGAGEDGASLSVFDRNTALSVLLMGALAPVAGSAISFLLATFLLWGALGLASGRVPLQLSPSDRAAALAFTLFACLVLVTASLQGNGLDPGSMLWLLPFLSLWVIIPRMRASGALDLPRLYILGSGLGCIGAFVLASINGLLASGIRPEGGAGNAAIFASLCLCLSGFAALGVDSPSRRHRLFAVVAGLMGALALISSLTRGVILGLGPVLVLVAVYARLERPAGRVPVSTLLLLALPALFLYGFWDAIEHRIDYSIGEISAVLQGGYSASTGERLRLWSAAMQAIADSPLVGYGVEDRMNALRPYLHDGRYGGYSHPHNGYLTAALDGGIVVLAAMLAMLFSPAVIAWQAPRDETYRKRLFLALVLVVSYAVIGVTQILFNHDILDSFFIFSTIVVAASIPYARRAPVQSGEGAASGLRLEESQQKYATDFSLKSHANKEIERFRASRGSGIALALGVLFDFGERWLFPPLAVLVTVAGTLQQFLTPGMKTAARAIFGF